jgi:hypothetical protein
MNTQDPLAVRRGRRQLLLLAAIFFVPLALAFWLYYGADGWRPGGGTNKGELIDPPRLLPEAGLVIAGGSPAEEHFLRGKWTVIYVGDGYCDERCRKALYLTRQSRLALNKDSDRVRRVLVATGRCCDNRFIETEHTDLVVLLPAGQKGAQFLERFPVYSDGPVATAGRIYLVDPLGNLLMSYPATAPDNALLTDLRKLLRLSHIG